MLIRYRPRHVVRGREPVLPTFLSEDFFTDFWRGFEDLGMKEAKIELKEEKKNYLVRAELPGYGQDEVKAEVVDGVLNLTAEHKDEKWNQDEDAGWRSIETRSGRFHRSIPLPEDVVTEKIKAQMKDGVLRLTLPRDPKPEKPVKEIPIH